MDTGADLPALETVCREMSVAILRLEAQTGLEAREGSAASPPRSVEQYDVPLTLAEFMASNCVGGSKLTAARLESFTKSLQNAARRKGSGVALPKHVGRWRPGQRKYYRPSQLRRAWPGFARHLPYLPPLMSGKP